MARLAEGRAADLETELGHRHTADARTQELTESADRWRTRAAELEQVLSPVCHGQTEAAAVRHRAHRTAARP